MEEIYLIRNIFNSYNLESHEEIITKEKYYHMLRLLVNKYPSGIINMTDILESIKEEEIELDFSYIIEIYDELNRDVEEKKIKRKKRN